MAGVIGVLGGGCSKETTGYAPYTATRTTRKAYICEDGGEGLMRIVQL